MAQSKISNPQSSEMTGMSNNSIFSETMENSTNPEVQPIAEQSEAAHQSHLAPLPSSARANSKITALPSLPRLNSARTTSIRQQSAMRRLTVSNALPDSSAAPVIASATLSSTSSMSISTITPPTMKAGSP